LLANPGNAPRPTRGRLDDDGAVNQAGKGGPIRLKGANRPFENPADDLARLQGAGDIKRNLNQFVEVLVSFPGTRWEGAG
jgi:hypothetical protein